MVNFVSVVEDYKYLLWQQEIQAENLRRLGVNLWVVVVCNKPEVSEDAKNLKNVCNVLIVNNEQEDRTYPPSNKPFGLMKLLESHPELGTDLFLLDSDVIFKKLPDFSEMTDPKGLYMSDCNSYLNWDYISSKYPDREALARLLSVAEVSEQELKNTNSVSGGAQYYFKSITKEYCERVLSMSHEVNRELKSAKEKGENDIQVWTAEMWAWLWVGIRFGYTFYTPKSLDFCWATDHISRWHNTDILHLAGVTSQDQGHFYKGKYTKLSPWESMDFSYVSRKDSCSWKYLEIVSEYKGFTLPEIKPIKKRAIVTYLERKASLINQFWGFYSSYKEAGIDSNTDFIVFTDDETIPLPDDVVVKHYSSSSRSGDFKDYHFINSVTCVADNSSFLSRYDYILKTDLDVFLTKQFLDFFPLVFHTGTGGYSHQNVPQKIKEFATKNGMYKENWKDNVGATWYGAGSLVTKVAKDTVELCRKLLTEETFGEWPGWYRGVASMYASEIAVNWNVDSFVVSDKFDAHSDSSAPTDSFYHIHCWHTNEDYSKFKFDKGEYNSVSPESLNKNITKDYCLAMALSGRERKV